MITDRNLKVGDKLVGRYHKQEHTCEVVDVDGKLKFRLKINGMLTTQDFKSPSAAGKFITGHECDGWHFWSILLTPAEAVPAGAPGISTEGLHRSALPILVKALEQLTTDKPVRTGKIKTPKATYEKTLEKLDSEFARQGMPGYSTTVEEKQTGTHRMLNQDGAPAGQARWYCYDCNEPFNAPANLKTTGCPNSNCPSWKA